MKEKQSFKKLLATIGLFSLGLTSLSLLTNQTKHELNTNVVLLNNETYATNEEIASAINGITYFIELKVNTKVSELRREINPEFIRSRLTGEVRNDFDDRLFNLNRIINEQGQEITDNDLAIAQVINARFNYSYGTVTSQTARIFIVTNVEDQQIVNEVNSILYQKDIPGGTTADELKAEISPDFIRSSLTGEIRNGFRENLFTLNKITDSQGKEITNDDLKTTGNIYAKIHYNYNTIKDQKTNLIITISDGLLELNTAFKDFNFQEVRGTVGFLDSNDLNEISNQIEIFLGRSLVEAGLILENQQATSILLKAQPNSKYYYGQVTLTWNLKLFEVTGQKLLSSPDIHVYNGFKLYIYLDYKDQQIKAFDYPGYRNAKTVIGYANSPALTHRFNFVNNKGGNQTFNIYSRDLTSDLPTRFGKFDLADGVQVNLTTTQPPYFIGVFQKDLNKWDAAIKRSYFIDLLGTVH